jgi:folate-binding protein YgfZ
MRELPKWFWWPRDFVRVAGPDAEAFLQGQLSQDVTAATRAWSFLLQPSGKVDALVRLHRIAADEFVLETDSGWGDHVRARLQKFLLRTKAEIAPLPEWRCLTVRGVDGDDPLPGLPGSDAVGPAPDVKEPDGVSQGTDDEWERLRIMAGVPRMGAELTEATIPAEAGQWWIERTVSFTKGCYTGQELVARIDSRGGHVPRPIRGVRLDGTASPGAAVVHDGKDVGVLTSVSGDVGLAPVSRAVEPGTDVAVDGVPARIEALPLIGAS